MEQQLHLIHTDEQGGATKRARRGAASSHPSAPPWQLDDAARDRARQGVARARQALAEVPLPLDHLPQAS